MLGTAFPARGIHKPAPDDLGVLRVLPCRAAYGPGGAPRCCTAARLASSRAAVPALVARLSRAPPARGTRASVRVAPACPRVRALRRRARRRRERLPPLHR